MIGEFQRKMQVKFSEPAVYAVAISCTIAGPMGVGFESRLFVYMCLAYTLDGALEEAKKWAVKKYPDTLDYMWVLQTHTFLNMAKMEKALTELNLVIKDETDDSIISEKNILMKKIINLKDNRLFEEHRASFTNAEIQYIERFLK